MSDVTIEEIRKLFEYYNSGTTILDIIYNIVTFMMLIVSIFSFRVAWKVYCQSEVMHKENMDLTRKMHADSLTPYVVIKSACNYIFFVTDRFPELKIDKIEISNGIYINDAVKVDIDELQGKIYVEIVMFNMSDVPAEVTFKCKCLECERIYNEYLVGKEEKVIKIENDDLSLNKQTIDKAIKNCINIIYDLSYNGPGMSAHDFVSGQMKLHYNSKGKTISSIVGQLKRERKYD